jgi:DsbE subfamily thiol:disulfide oxidoreductase
MLRFGNVGVLLGLLWYNIAMVVRCFISIILTFASVGCASTPATTAATSPTIGSPAPPLALPTLDGMQTVDLETQRGNVVLLNFWASWCEPCKREMPALQQWHAQHAEQGLAAIGVDTLYQDDRAAAEAFVATNGITYPILADEAGDTSRQWLIQGLPRTYVIDRDGVVRALKLGEFTQADFDAHVVPLLRE